MPSKSTNIALDFRDNEKMFSPMAPDAATKGVEIQMGSAPIEAMGTGLQQTLVPAVKPPEPIDLGRVALLATNDPKSMQGLNVQPTAASSDINYACKSMGSILGEFLGGSSNEPAMKNNMQPMPNMAMNMRPQLGGLF